MNYKMSLCKEFFDSLTAKLSETYEVLQSCNADCSAYLCPIGTTGQVTYSGKPELSFRISDHWNWYANISKCPNEKCIQCFSSDLPYAHKRRAPGMAGAPIHASSVCIFVNGRYTVVYGESYDRKTKKWSWIENDLDSVMRMI